MEHNDPQLPMDVETEEEKLKRMAQEAEINKVPPQPGANIGPDTTGVGQPTSQAVPQGQSLPAAQVSVKPKLEGNVDNFYDPMADERAADKKARSDTGGKKADF